MSGIGQKIVNARVVSKVDEEEMEEHHLFSSHVIKIDTHSAKGRKSAWCSRVANSLLQSNQGLKGERALGAGESPILSCNLIKSYTMAGAGRGHSLGASPLAMVGRGSSQSGSPLSVGRGGSSGSPLSPKQGASSPSSGQQSPQKRKENPVDKFAEGRMDVEAVKAFFCWAPGRAIKQTLEAFKNTMGQELTYRAGLCHLFPAFWMLSKKATQVVDVGEEYQESEGCDASGGRSQSPYLHRTFMSTGMC
ncbi:hypothetical protein GOP47_0005582 [Adiantum capillus-veneris]|uniref:Uncharacterized protein n=1 Tax=Adiantum capillus-veneris TaxID=13818 RepID=A0A9D4V6J3_ADICA|nr:hypothetical protein GOP47_0005582 [Adiantum capillus-veneris]